MFNQMPFRNANERMAFNAATVGIVAYFLLAMVKLFSSVYFESPTLQADGLNNMSDVLSSCAIALSIFIASRPADANHRFGHQRYETIASFIASILMFLIGFEVISSSVVNLIRQRYVDTNLLVIYVSFASLCFLGIIYRYIRNAATRTRSIALKATAKDMLNDLMITVTPILGALLHRIGFPQGDLILSIGVGILIMISSFQLFSESSFALSDGFDQEALQEYRQAVQAIPDVCEVTSIRGRISGQYIYLDIVITLDKNLTVLRSHEITEEVERILLYNYDVHDVDVHVEPFGVETHHDEIFNQNGNSDQLGE